MTGEAAKYREEYGPMWYPVMLGGLVMLFILMFPLFVVGWIVDKCFGGGSE